MSTSTERESGDDNAFQDAVDYQELQSDITVMLHLHISNHPTTKAVLEQCQEAITELLNENQRLTAYCSELASEIERRGRDIRAALESRDSCVDALRELYDEQDGPPLYCREHQWIKAMEHADRQLRANQ